MAVLNKTISEEKVRHLIFLSVNDKYLPTMAEHIEKDFKGVKEYVAREGVDRNIIKALIEKKGSIVIPYQESTYKKDALRKVLDKQYDKCIIFTRDIGTSLNYFKDLLDVAREKTRSILLMDVFGRKKSITVFNVWFQEHEEIGKKWLMAVEASTFYFISVLIFMPCMLFALLGGLLALSLARVRSLIIKRKFVCCFAKRVHSNQSALLVKGMRARGYHSFSINVVDHPFKYESCDIYWSLSHLNKYARFVILNLLFIRCALKADIFLFQNSGESFFVNPLFNDFNIPRYCQYVELSMLKLLGKRIIFVMRDCTVRTGHKEYCGFCPTERRQKLCGNKKYSKSNVAAARFADKIVVSTVDLLERFPEKAIWLPNACANIPSTGTIEERDKIIIVHSSTGVYNMKGTRVIERVIDRLKDRYPIEFILLRTMSHEDALNIISTADICIGQLYLGVYGNFEIECMMSGKPVIAYLNNAYQKFYPETPPIISVDNQRLEESLTSAVEVLITEKKQRKTIGAACKQYAERVHSVQKVSERLCAIVEEFIA